MPAHPISYTDNALVRERTRNAKLTQTQVAVKLGVTQILVSRWENTGWVKKENARKLEKLFVPLTPIFDWHTVDKQGRVKILP
jgi:transcriptional regulator with XRE-family HTH domain